MLSEPELCALHPLDFEVASPIPWHVMGGKLSAERGSSALSDFADVRVHRYDCVGLLPKIWRIREDFTCYDAAYIALASALDAPLVTSDVKLSEASRLGVEIQVFRPV